MKGLKESASSTKQGLEETEKRLEETKKELQMAVLSKDASKIELEVVLRENEKLTRQNKKVVMELEAMEKEKNEIKRNTINEACAHYSEVLRETEIQRYQQGYEDCRAGRPSIAVNGEFAVHEAQ